MLGEDWPSPPTFQYLLLENPWPLLAVGLIAGVALFVVGGRQGRQKMQWAGLGALAAGVGVFALASAIETERERLEANTREVVDAFAHPFNAEQLERHVSEDVTLFNWPVGHLVPVAERSAEAARVTEYFVRRVLVEQDGPNHARTGVQVWGRIEHSRGENGFSAHAIFHWRRQPGGQWELYHVPDVWLNDESAESLVRRFARF